MQLKYILIIAINLVGINIFSQAYVLSENPNKLSSTLVQKSKEINSLKGEFIQNKKISSLGMEVISKGNFQYKKNGTKILWNYISPSNFTVLFLNNEIKVKQTGKNSENSITQNSLLKALNTIIINSFSGDFQKIEGFSKEVLENENKILLKFTSKEKELIKIMTKVEIYFNKTDYRVSEIKLYETNNDITSILFKELIKNPSISDSIFNL